MLTMHILYSFLCLNIKYSHEMFVNNNTYFENI